MNNPDRTFFILIILVPHDWSSNRPEIEFTQDNDINFRENYSSKYEENMDASASSVAKFGDGFRKQQAVKTAWEYRDLDQESIIIIISWAGWVRQDGSNLRS